MVNIANISINNSKNESNIVANNGSNSINQDILKELREINTSLKETNKANTLSRNLGAGFAGGVGGGLLSSLLGELKNNAGTLVATGEAMASGQYGMTGMQLSEFNQSTTGFAKVETEEGKRLIVEVNNKTGNIVRELTEQEAHEKGITDEAGNIKIQMTNTGDIWKNRVKLLEDSQGYLVASKRMNQEINNLEEDEKKIQEQINEAKKAKLDKLGGSSGSSSKDNTMSVSDVNAALGGSYFNQIQTNTGSSSIVQSEASSNSSVSSSKAYQLMYDPFYNNALTKYTLSSFKSN